MKNVTKRDIVRFLEKLSGEKEGKDFQVMSGKQGKEFSEYSFGRWLVIFDGSNLYDAFNHYDEGNCYARDNKFHEWCDELGLIGELGNAWNMNISRKKDF